MPDKMQHHHLASYMKFTSMQVICTIH